MIRFGGREQLYHFLQIFDPYPLFTLSEISRSYYLKHTTFTIQGQDIPESVNRGYNIDDISMIYNDKFRKFFGEKNQPECVFQLKIDNKNYSDLFSQNV